MLKPCQCYAVREFQAFQEGEMTNHCHVILLHIIEHSDPVHIAFSQSNLGAW